jgi:adenylylsulfate kinase-like enzyme
VEDDERVYSAEFEEGDPVRLHKLWADLIERRDKKRERQRRITTYVSYLSAASGIIVLLTFLRGYISSFFHAAGP